MGLGAGLGAGASVGAGGAVLIRRNDVREDVAIVGAGPAGARAAYVLARAGARVTIFDGSHPREKPCGGGVTGRALALVADAIAPTAFPQTAIRSARFTQVGLRGQTSKSDLHVGPRGQTSRSDRGARVDLAPGALAVASREALDGALLAAAQGAGATLVRSRVA